MNMKRRFGVLLCLLLLVSLLPLTAAAGEEPITVTTASGSTDYSDFSSAWDAVAAAKTATITVHSDVTTTGSVSLTAGMDVTLVVEENATLTFTGTTTLRVTTSAKLTVKGEGSIAATNAAAVLMNNTAAQVDIQGCSFTATKAGTYCVQATNGTMHISGGEFTGNTYALWTAGGGARVYLSGGLFHPGSAGSIHNNSSVTEADGSNYYLGTMLDPEAGVAYHYAGNGGGWTSGMTADGTAIKTLGPLYGDVTVEPMPLQLSLVTSAAVVVNAGSSTTMQVSAAVSGDPSEVHYQWYLAGTAIDGATEASYAIPTDLEAGKDYSYQCVASYAGFEARSTVIKVTVAPANVSYACWYSLDGAKPVFQNDLSSALSTARDADKAEIHLMQNVELSSTVTLNRGNIFLYCEEYTLSSSASQQIFSITGTGKLTLMNGTIHYKASNAYVALVKPGGTFTMEGGAIHCDQRQSYGVYGFGGSIIINGGSIVCSGASSVGVICSSGSVADFYGGSVTANGTSAMALRVAENGTMNVYGGSFSSESIAVSVYSGKMSLAGGRFSGVINCTQTAGTLNNILADGYAIYVEEGANAGWVTKPNTVSSVGGTMEVRLIPVELISATETVDILVNGYSTAPVLSVAAQARNGSSPVTYQWYRCTVASASGEVDSDFVALPGENGSSFTVPLGLENIRMRFVCAITCEEYEIRTEDVVVTVAPAGYVHDAPTGVTALFGQTLRDVTMTNPDGNSAGVWSWKEPSAAVGSVGEHTFTAVFTPDLDWLYEPVEAEVTVTVEKSAPVIVINPTYKDSKPLDKEYNGLAALQPDTYYITVDGISDAKITFRWYGKDSSDQYVLLSAAPVNAGTYEVEAYLAETANAKAATARMEVVIRPKLITPTVVLSQYKYTYDRTAHVPTVTVRDGKTALDSSEYLVAITDNINAGTATVTVTDAEGGNYIFQSAATETFDIAKVVLTVQSAEGVGKVYDGLPEIDITKVGLKGRVYLDGAADSVAVDVTGLQGYVTSADSHPNAGTYYSVLFKSQLTLVGANAANYTLTQPTGFVSLQSGGIEITKYEIPAENMVVLSKADAERFVSNRYEFTYQWPMAALFPTVDLPMRWDSPEYTWEANLNGAYYCGASSGGATSASNKDIYFSSDKLFLPIRWTDGNQPVIAEGGSVEIGTITIYMKPANYKPFCYTLSVTANTKVTAVIIDWKEAETQTYNGQGVRGYDFSDNATSIGIRPVTADPSSPAIHDVNISVTYTGREDTLYAATTAMPVNAGKYRVTASVDKNDSNYIGIDSFDFEILKAEPAYATEPAAEESWMLFYDGGPRTLIQPGTSHDGELAYSLDENGPFSRELPFGVSVDTYRVYYKIIGDRNHLNSDVSYLDVEITKSEPYFVAPKAISGLMYDGQPVELVIPGRTADGTFLYSLEEDGPFTTDIPTGREVKTYTVYYKVQGDSNHTDSAVASIRVNVGIVNLTVRSVRALDRVYNGSDVMNVVVSFYENVTNDDLGVKCDARLVLGPSGTPDVGEYERVNISNLRLTGADAGNYHLVATELQNVLFDTPIHITKAATASVTVDKYVQIYSPRVYEWELSDLLPAEIPVSLRAQNPATYTLGYISFEEPYYSGGARIEDGKLIIPIDEVDSQTDKNKIGTINIDLEFENYENVTCYFKLISGFKPNEEITGVTSMGSVPYTGSGIKGYTGTPSSAHTGEYDVFYEGVGDTEYPITKEMPVNVGSYNVIIRIPSTNQDVSGSVTLSFEIVRAAPVVTGIDDGAVVYTTGDPVPLLPDASTNGGTLLYALETESGALVYSTTVPVAEETGEYVVWFRVDGNESYLAQDASKVTITVRTRTVSSNSASAPGSDSNSAEATMTAVNMDGVVTATLNAVTAEQVADEAVSSGSDAVKINTAMNGQSASQMHVVLRSDAVRTISARTDVPVTVSTPTADLTFTPEGMDALAELDGDLDISLVQDEEGGVRIVLTVDGEPVTDIPGGVSLSIALPEAEPGMVAVLVDENGNETMIRKSAVGDGTIGLVVNGSAYVKWVSNEKQFEDVPAGHWAENAVAFVSSHELMKGTSETTFSPDLPVTRGMLAQMLFNLESEPDAVSKANFTDVASGSWYEAAIDWASGEGIVLGYGDGTFGPEDAITRQQLAAMLYRYMGSPTPGEAVLDFVDADEISAYALPAMRWAVRVGLFSGRDGKVLAPADTATRAETAIVLQRLCAYMTGMR